MPFRPPDSPVINLKLTQFINPSIVASAVDIQADFFQPVDT